MDAIGFIGQCVVAAEEEQAAFLMNAKGRMRAKRILLLEVMIPSQEAWVLPRQLSLSRVLMTVWGLKEDHLLQNWWAG